MTLSVSLTYWVMLMQLLMLMLKRLVLPSV